MHPFILSAFADEIDPSLSKQMEVLEKLGIRHIEMRGVDGKNISELSLREAAAIKERLDEKGFRISALGSPIGKISITQPFAPHLELFRHVLELARILDTKYIRLFSFFIPEGEDPAAYRAEVLMRMQAFIQLAEQKGVILLHENEKEIYGDTAQRCLDLLSTLDSPYLRATFDPANFVQCGVEPYPDAWDLLSDYVEYMHIKDALFANGEVVPAGQGDGQIADLVQALQRKNYAGFLSLEPHLGDFLGFAALENRKESHMEDSDGVRLFHIAYQALMQILENKGD